MCFLTAPLTYPKRFHKDLRRKKVKILWNSQKVLSKTKVEPKLEQKINGDFLLTQCWKRTSQKFLLFLKWRLQLCSTFVGLPMAFNDDDNHKEIKDQKCWFRKTHFCSGSNDKYLFLHRKKSYSYNLFYISELSNHNILWILLQIFQISIFDSSFPRAFYAFLVWENTL